VLFLRAAVTANKMYFGMKIVFCFNRRKLLRGFGRLCIHL
jgi:hypothetical protein